MQMMSELVDIIPPTYTTIDPEFASMIPPLSVAERRELEASIVEYGGARDPLIAWYRGRDTSPILLDGHNRMEICKRLCLPYHVKGMEFADREAAIRWIHRNQLGRRNLSRQDFVIMLGRLYNQSKRPLDRSKKNPRIPTAAKLATVYRVDPRTVTRAGSFQAAAQKLGIEEDIASGRLQVPAGRLVRAARSVPENPTKEQVDEALKKAMDLPMAPHRDNGQSRFLVAASPSDCLKAVKFYAMSFVQQSPESADVLVEHLTSIVESVRR
jgi:hypothetical protein